MFSKQHDEAAHQEGIARMKEVMKWRQCLRKADKILREEQKTGETVKNMAMRAACYAELEGRDYTGMSPATKEIEVRMYGPRRESLPTNYLSTMTKDQVLEQQSIKATMGKCKSL